MQIYECKNCGAELYFDPKKNVLKCEYCDSEYQVSDFEDSTKEDVVEEAVIEDGNEEDDKNDMVIYSCSNCGAEIVTTKGTMATTCPYCDRAVLITSKSTKDFRPNYLVPFEIDQKKAKEIYNGYVAKSILASKQFKTNHKIDEMKGLYVPFWLHSREMEADCRVNCENVSDVRIGYDKIVTTELYEVSVKATNSFENIPTDASVKMNDEMMDNLEPFDYKKLKDFHPAYMAGFFAEQPDTEKEATESRVDERIKDALSNSVLSEITQYQTRSMKNISLKTINNKVDYAMLPIWYFFISENGKKYEFAVNANTGKVVGNVPISKKKCALYSGIVGAVFFLLSLVIFL